MSIRSAVFAVALLAPLSFHAQEPAASAAAAPVHHVPISTGVLNRYIVRKVPPTYPDDALSAHIEGSVGLRILLDEHGRIEDLQPMSGPAELRPAAMDAVRQWTFKPFLLNGNPVPVASILRINFELRR